MTHRHAGFTLLEVMVVIVIIAILSMIAVPSVEISVVRKQVEAALELAEIAKRPVAATWAGAREFVPDNAAAGLPVPEKVVNNYVSSLAIDNGVITIVFGNRAHPKLQGKTLTVRPAVIADAPVVPVTWVCAGANPPAQMTVKGEDRTTVLEKYLPLACRKIRT